MVVKSHDIGRKLNEERKYKKVPIFIESYVVHNPFDVLKNWSSFLENLRVTLFFVVALTYLPGFFLSLSENHTILKVRKEKEVYDYKLESGFTRN